MARTYIISEICGDWALQIREPGHPHQFLYFNSENNADLVKSILEWEDAHPNEAVPYNPTLTPPNEPLTQEDIDKMHFDRVWIDYGLDDSGERCGEDGVILYGKLYSIDTLDGSAFEDLLLNACDGETLGRPSGDYTVYRRPPEGEEDDRCQTANYVLRIALLRGMT